MGFELPSLPKSVLLNSALIVAILLGAIIAMVGFWQFVPLLLNETTDEQRPSELEIDFTYMRVVTQGEFWNISGVARNPSNETLNNIKIRIFSDGNIQGYEHTIVTLEGKEQLNFTLYPKIKESALLGDFTAQTVVSVPDTLPAEYMLDIVIK